jgi:hypothetical protein
LNIKNLETEINGHGNSLRRLRNILYPKTLALTSTTSGGLSVGIVPLRTKFVEYSFFFITFIRIRDSVVGIPIGYGLEDRGV